jgi:hypothetical protein
MDILLKVVVVFAAVSAGCMFLRDVYHAIIGDEEENG